MKKLIATFLFILASETVVFATTNPPYYGTTISTANGTASQYVSGRIKLAKSSATADTTTITVDGTTGGITLSSFASLGGNLMFTGSTDTKIYIGTHTFMHMTSVLAQGYGQNLFFGMDAGKIQTTLGGTAGLSGNTAFGNQAMSSCITTSGASDCLYNSAFGYLSLHTNTTGWGNDSYGWEAMLSNTSGNQNSAFGQTTLAYNTTGSSNTALGNSALYTNTTGGNNTAVGWASLSGGNVGTMTGSANTVVGSAAMAVNTTGQNNTCIGYACLNVNTIGVNNSAVGEYSLSLNTAGYSNAAIGMNTLANSVHAYDNTALGYTALQFDTLGNDNTAVGLEAMNLNTSGSQNSAVGVQALKGNTTGTNNVGIGYLAGYTQTTGNALTTTSSNVYVGFNSGPGTSTQLTNAGCIGASCRAIASNMLRVGGQDQQVGFGNGANISTFTLLGELQLVSISSRSATVTGGTLSFDKTANTINVGNGLSISTFNVAGSVDWVPTFVGFFSSPTVTATYSMMGKLCFIHVEVTLTGFSNATNYTMTLPFKAARAQTNAIGGMGVDNGGSTVLSTPVRGDTTVGSATLTLYSSLGSGLWTNTGNKYAWLHGWYETQ